MIPLEQHYPFTLPPLPYGYDALEPELDEKVLRFHHDKHFAAYVDALNQLLERAPAYQSWSLRKLCLRWEALPEELRQGVRNNAGGVYNHGLYFRTLHPLPASAPEPPLEGAVLRSGGAEGRHAAGSPGTVRLRLGLADHRPGGPSGRPKDPQPGHAPAADAPAVL